MALVTISGFPCSGKTRRAEQIRDAIDVYITDESYRGMITKVVILSGDGLGIKRNVYDDSRSEKPARGALFSAIQRQMAMDTILIVDELNYIKGFRYQMYCAAREMKLRVCTVYVVALKQQCREWNNLRQENQKYAPETLENLIFGYEEPSSMVRWDSPLFTVLWDEDTPPMAQIWEALTQGNIKPPNSGTLSVIKAPTDALHALEQTTTAIITAILAEQTGLGGEQRLSIPGSTGLSKVSVALPARKLTLSELQRLKRQFVVVHKKAITLGTTEKGVVSWDEANLTSKFITYLEEHVKSYS
ncbi:hypothetical protein H0H93_008632 [Arthromyces matolae]|nr:hypothetical protein H0H93_008632 [Arthromyces matolae]